MDGIERGVWIFPVPRLNRNYLIAGGGENLALVPGNKKPVVPLSANRGLALWMLSSCSPRSLRREAPSRALSSIISVRRCRRPRFSSRYGQGCDEAAARDAGIPIAKIIVASSIPRRRSVRLRREGNSACRSLLSCKPAHRGHS